MLHALKEWVDGLQRHRSRSFSRLAAPDLQDRRVAWPRHEGTQNVRLGQVYVLVITAANVDERASVLQSGRFDEQRLLHRLGDESLYVPSKPGAGKSTFCRWVALAVASSSIPPHPIGAPVQFEEQLPDALRGRFPLLCPLPQ